MIDFRTLGGIDLREADGPAIRSVLSQPKRLAFLAYLALERPGHLHRRDSLIGVFWPELEDERARAVLRRSLHYLRRSLGEGVLAGHGEEAVGVSEDGLRCDALEFERAVEAGDRARALELYGGDLLDGLFVPGAPEFERWLDRRRWELRDRATQAAWEMAERELEDGNPVGAAHWGRRAFAIDAFGEAGLRRLLALLDRLGDRAGAVLAYEEFARRARAEGVEPAPETLALVQEIRERHEPVPVEEAFGPTRDAGAKTSAAPPHGRELPQGRPTGGGFAVPLPDDDPAGAGHSGIAVEQRRIARSRSLPGVPLAAMLSLLVIVPVLTLAALFSRTSLPAARSPMNSLVVLPLENLSGDPTQDYFADGVTDALIGELAKIGALRVISRTSAINYKGVSKPIPVIGRELDVDAVVEGTVLRSGDRVRIRVQLIEAATDDHLWAESYDRDLRDILSLQSEIAEAVAREISVQILPDERTRLVGSLTVDRQAFDHYLQGRYHLSKLTKEEIHQAMEHFDSAIRADPSYASAYVGLAKSYELLGYVMTGGLPPIVSRTKAAEAARKALEIDDQLAEAHTILATVNHHNWQWAEAEKGFQRALELNPNYSSSAYAGYLVTLGRTEEALAEIDRVQQVDPLSVSLRWAAGMIAYEARRYDEAVSTLSRVIEMAPEFEHAYWTLGLTYLAQGRTGEAIALLEEARTRLEGQLSVLSVLGMAYGRAGRRAEAEELLDEITELSRRRYVPAGNFLDIHLGLGNTDEAFAWLEKAYQAGSTYVTHLKVLPEVDAIRPDPRFDDLLRRIGLPSG